MYGGPPLQLYMKFRLPGGLVPLNPTLLKGQLYIYTYLDENRALKTTGVLQMTTKTPCEQMRWSLSSNTC